jgi:hypothetical protein
VHRPGFEQYNYLARGILAAVWAALLLVSAASADERFDWLTVGSTTYSNVTVLNKTRTDMFISHAWGMANIKVRDMDTKPRSNSATCCPRKRSPNHSSKPNKSWRT